MSSNFSSMAALLGALAVAGYQNRDKIGELLNSMATGAAPVAQPQSSSGGGLGGLGDLLGGGGAGAGGGLLGSLLSGLTGGSGGAGGGGLGGLLGGLLGNAGGQDAGSVLSGGLGQLVQELQKNGLGEQADSWVSTGPNQDVTPQQLGQAIDPQILSSISQATGLDAQDLLGRLAHVLPQAVDSMTPHGRLPQA